VTDRYSELRAIDLEELPRIAGHVEGIFARVELVLGLVSTDPALGVDDTGANLAARRRELFHPEDRGHRVCSRPLRYGLERAFLLRLVPGQYLKILSPQPREIGLRKAHDLRALGRGLGQEPLDLVQAVLEGGGDARRCQRNDHG
jgi:hypothetical protein